MSLAIPISRVYLKNLYEKQKLTTYEIAKKIGCCQATVWKRLIEFNIKRRKPYELYSNVPTKEKLIKLYIDQKLSTWKIEKLYGYSRGTVHRKLREFGIKTRSLADSNIKYQRYDFSGDLLEKSYLIGFRIGDLGVRKIYPNSKTICVASGSTIPEQINLINGLFSKYGNVWIGKTKNGKINIQFNLNESFNFLLSRDVPSWIINNKKFFFSFLSGFIDAEGHIGIYRNMARFTLGNYDSKLLFIIYNNLKKYKIKSRAPFSDKRKGKVNNQGYTYRENYWHFGIYDKSNLKKLFKEIKPYVRHKNKIKALNMALENIEWRNMHYGK